MFFKNLNFILGLGLNLILAVSALSAQSVEARAVSFDSLRSLVVTGHLPAALSELEKIKEKKLTPEQRPLWKFAKGVLYFENQKWAKAQKELEEFLQKPSDLSAYAFYYLGMSLRNQNQLEEAQKIFEKTLKLAPPQLIQYQTRFALSEIHMNKQKWPLAFKNLFTLERKWRSTPRHPEVLWRLITTDLHQNKRWRACKWASKLYSTYPAHPLVYDWSIDLHNSIVDGAKLGCLASPAEQKKRLRHLQLAGESERARKEIEELRKRTTPATRYVVDIMFAEFQINEGFVDEALQSLLPLYEARSRDFDYLMLFAKAASRVGEFQSAVGAYHKAYELRPKSEAGRHALFQAAFLSYQFQDYDGAARKFREFIARYPKSGLSYDGRWHLAWIRYLRKDFQGSYDDLAKLYGMQRKGRRLSRRYPSDRIRYWMAMSLLKMEKSNEARGLLEGLIKEEPTGYYALVARSRLLTLPSESAPVIDIAAESNRAPGAAQPMILADLNTPSVLPSAGDESAETEEKLAVEEGAPVEEPDAKEEITGNEDEALAEGEAEEDEKPDPVTEFKSPKLQARFDRAKKLMDLGFNEWARWELYEIEKRTRNKTYLRMLMNAYEDIESYNRSAHISEINFGSARHNGGIKKEKELWKLAYPEAYKTSVNYYADKFEVEKEFIWSIMRAESQYKADVASPVGAKGLMQLMPGTSRQVARLLGEENFHVETLVQPDVNIKLGSSYLKRLSKKFDGNMALVAAGYNAGPHRVDSWLMSFGHLEMDEFIDHIPFLETRNYVKKVIRNYTIYREIYAGDTKPLAWLKEPMKVPIPERQPTRETWDTL